MQVTLRSASAAPYLVVSEPYDPDWSANGQHASEELGALTGFTKVPPGTISITYARWPAVRDSYVASGAILLILFGLIAIPSYRRRRKVSDPSALDVFNVHVGALSEPAPLPAQR